jgi:hypothetical protein
MNSSDAPQPTSATLSAKIIRKCPTHSDCPLTCKQRRVEDLGEIASCTTTEPAAGADWISRMYHKFFDKESS